MQSRPPSVVLATGGYDHTIRFWEATSGVCYRTLQHQDSQVNKLEITPDKKFIAAAGNPYVRLFEVHTSNPQAVTTYEGHTSNVTSVGFQRDGAWMYTSSEDGTVKIWDVRAPGCQREYESRAAVNTVALHPNQSELISGDQNGNIRVWDLTAGACSCELVPEVGCAVRSLAVASDGSLAVAANSRGVCYVWRLTPGAGAGGGPSPNGVQTTTTNSTHFEPLHKLVAHPDAYILKCLISPDVRTLATAGSDKVVRLWSLENHFALDSELVGHSKWVWDCVYSVDAAYLVTASSDGSAKLWDVAKGDAIRTYNGHHKAVVCCALNDSAVPDPGRT